MCNMNREEWKKLHRSMRIARREVRQAAIDSMIFGTGILFVPAPGDGSDVKCIRPWEYNILKEGDTNG